MVTSAWAIAVGASYAKWFMFPAVAAIWILAWQERNPDVTYWPTVTEQVVFQAQFVLALLCLGLGAWQGRADRHPAVAELSATMRLERSTQLFIGWLTVAAWRVAAYCVAVSTLLGVLAGNATWGAPDWQPIVNGAAVIVGAAGIGYGLGFAVPTFVLIPVWTIAWFVIDADLPIRYSRISWAAPRSMSENVDRSIFRETVPAYIDLRQGAWLIALGISVIAVCGLLSCRTQGAKHRAIVAMVLLTITSASLFATPGNAVYGTGQLRAYEPVCKSSEYTSVCVHPAERPLLDNALSSLSAMLAPLSGISGISSEFRTGAGENSPNLYLGDKQSVNSDSFDAVLPLLLPDAFIRFDSGTYAQSVVVTWLFGLAGNEYADSPFRGNLATNAQGGARLGEPSALNLAPVERFNSMTLAEQQEWFRANIEALRNGTLEDSALP